MPLGAVRVAVLSGGTPTSSDSDVSAWIAAIRSANTTQAEVNALTAMVVGMKADGSWAKLDRLWVYATGTAAAAAVDLVARSSHSLVNSPTFTTKVGYTGDGASMSINSNFNCSTATNYAQNDAFAGVYVQTGDTNTVFRSFIGSSSGGANDGPALGRNVGTIFWDMNHSTSTPDAFTFASQIGFYGAERTASNAQGLYYNSTTTVATDANVSGAIGNRASFVLANNQSGSANNFSNATISAVALGKSGVMATGFSTRVKTCLVALGGSGNFP